MDIIVTRTIKKRELDGLVSEEARKLFAKLKDRPEIAAGISSPGLPARTTLHGIHSRASSRHISRGRHHDAIARLPIPETVQNASHGRDP